MKTLSIDLETFSSFDLPECGVHKYVEAPDFDIELFGYSIDYGPVRVIDMADGERIPDEIVAMLTDADVLKTAYNAPFERTCLAQYFGTEMPPEQWDDTLVLAASLGLPLGLKAVCEAMGLAPDQAKKDGDALIRYFAKPCKPTITNQGRTRNMPWDDYEKWEKYKSYNKRDVEVENLIRKKLEAHKLSNNIEHKFWVLDQNINDKGVRLDLDIANNAIDFNDRYCEGLTAEAKRISGISNLKSQVQIKKWLESVEGVVFDSLNKKAMPEVLASLQTEEAKQLLDIRAELSKTSTAKFDKMLTCACSDSHARGLFQFYGATRTGRFAGRLLQLQNLPQNHLEDLEDTRALVKAGKYEELKNRHNKVSSVLSELIRTAIVPEPGCHFIVADFSAIEARVISYICGEEWRLDVFRNNGDIYCESASQIFKVPVVKNGVNGHLRQRGKVAELACIAEGQLVLTDSGLKPIETVTTGDKLWDGNDWVTHEGVIYKGIREVIEYDGLTATKDHLVWVEGKQKPIQFGLAAANRSHLLQTGDGGRAIRMGEDNISREKMDTRMDEAHGSNKMHGLRKCTVDKSGKSETRVIEWVSELLTAETDTKVARQKINRCKTEMPEPKGPRLQKLWRKRNTIQIHERYSSRIVDDRASGASDTRIGDRQDRHKRKLRTWESEVGYTCDELREPKAERSIEIRGAILALCANHCGPKTKSRSNTFGDYIRSGESRIRETEELAVYRGKAKVYDIRNAGRHNRFTVSGKLVHNCGYGGGVAAMRSMDVGRALAERPDSEIQEIINGWRESSPHIVAWWKSMENAAKKAIKTKSNALDTIGNILFQYEQGNLFMVLPSGRRICYVNAQICTNRFGNESVGYMGQNQTTHKWELLETYGGKLVENCVQATARDCLRDCMLKLDSEGYDIRMHVHDEVIINEPNGSGRTLDDVIDIMRQAPEWAKDLPLNAAGFEAEFYMKD